MIDLSTELAHLRAELTPEEITRFRALGKRRGPAINDAARAGQPGQTEHEIAAKLAYAAERQGVQAVVVLIAADERISAYRHPLAALTVNGQVLQRPAILEAA